MAFEPGESGPGPLTSLTEATLAATEHAYTCAGYACALVHYHTQSVFAEWMSLNCAPCRPSSGQAQLCMQQYSNRAGWLYVRTCATAGAKCHTHGSSVITQSSIQQQSYLWVQHLDRLFLGFHDVWQGGIARLVQPQVSSDDSWQTT